MQSRGKSVWVALVFSGALVLAACSGGTSTSTEDTSGETSTESSDSGEQIVLKFWDNQQTESGLSEFQQIAIDEFMAANPNIKIEVETIPYPEYQQRLQLAVQGGNAPDVATADQIWTAGLAAAGNIIALDDYVANSATVKKENFFPGAWESAEVDGKVYGVPFNVDVWQFSFYNKDLLDAEGITPDSLSTWEGLREAGQKLTKDGNFGVGLFSHKGEDTTVVMNSFIFSNGGDVLDASGMCALDEQPAVEALEYLKSLQPYAPEGILNNSSGSMRELFLNKTLAVEFWPALEQPTLQDSDINWGFVNGTAPAGKTPIGAYGGWNLSVFSSSPNQDAAFKFVEFLTSKEVNGRVVDLIPANVEAADAFLNANRVEPDKIIEHLNNARPRPLSTNYLEVSTIQQEMMQEIFNGANVQTAADSACEKIDALN